MTFTAEYIRLPAGTAIRPGQFARFNALGGFMRVEDYLSNGLGTIYRMNRDGSFSRYFF